MIKNTSNIKKCQPVSLYHDQFALCTILELETCKVQALKTTNMVSLCLCKFHVFCLLWQGLQFRQTIVLCLPGRSVRIHNYPCLYQFSTLGCFTIFISYTLHNGIIIILELHLNFHGLSNSKRYFIIFSWFAKHR